MKLNIFLALYVVFMATGAIALLYFLVQVIALVGAFIELNF